MLEHEFYKALKEDSHYDIDDFKNDLEESNRIKQLLMVVKGERQYQLIQDQVRKQTACVKETCLQTVKKIVSDSEERAMYKFSEQEKIVLNAAYKVWIECKQDKRRCLWLYGGPNCGKTTWLKMFETIFKCSRLEINDEKFQNA